MSLSFVQTVQKTVWDLLISYKTQRIILIKDYKLGLFHKSLLVGVGIYLIYTILTSHSYMIKESPSATVNSWVSAQEFLLKLEQVQNGTRPTPDYCNNSDTNYIFDDFFTYLDNQCDLEAVVGEVFNEESTAVALTTYYQDRKLKKVKQGKDVNNFIPFVEDIELFFSHGFTTALGIDGANVKSTIKSRDKPLRKTFGEGKPINLKISELLEMANVKLDDRHDNSGGRPPQDDPRSAGWPLFRMTGVDITIELEYQNFRSSSVFDFSNELEAVVSATTGVWVSRGQDVFPKWDDKEQQLIPHQRWPQVISVSYRPSGQLGKVDAFTAIMNIAVSAAIFGVAKFICDSLGDFIVHEFYDKRYLDHGDHLAIKTLKEKVWDAENNREKSTRHLVSKALDVTSSSKPPKRNVEMPRVLSRMGSWVRGKKHRDPLPTAAGATEYRQNQGSRSPLSEENEQEMKSYHPEGTFTGHLEYE